MQGAVARVCLVVTAAILNHPLLSPPEENNATLPDRDEGLLDRMRAREEEMDAERARLEEEMSRQEASRGLEGEEEDSGRYDWYFWTALSLVVFLTVEVGRGEFAGLVATPEEEDEDDWAFVFPDKGELARFWEGFVRSSGLEGREFAEGLADDLLGALRDFEELEDCVCAGGAFESWTSGPPTFDLFVPLTPPVQEDVQDCVCGSADLGHEVLCLVHSGNGGPRPLERSGDPLLLDESSRASADLLANRFQVALTKAWGRIKRKYDFELGFRDVDALPGSLKVRFRSGRTVGLDLTPAIRYGETDAFYVPRFPSDDWTLSLAVYEENLLERFAKNFPERPCHVRCLQILSFLHEKQQSLMGKSGLTNYHLKTALLHVLLTTKPSDWRQGELEGRLRDVTGFLGRCLREKRLPHALLGNKRVPKDVGLPAEFVETEPPNLFRALVLRGDLHARTVEHFGEMLRNAGALVREYTPR